MSKDGSLDNLCFSVVDDVVARNAGAESVLSEGSECRNRKLKIEFHEEVFYPSVSFVRAESLAILEKPAENVFTKDNYLTPSVATKIDNRYEEVKTDGTMTVLTRSLTAVL